MIQVTSHPNSQKPPFNFYLGIQSPSTSVLALGATFPAVPIEALPPAVTPLPVAPPVAPGFVAMAVPDDAVCNAPCVEKSIIYRYYSSLDACIANVFNV